MKISCVIPTCNRGKFLAEAIMRKLSKRLVFATIMICSNLITILNHFRKETYKRHRVDSKYSYIRCARPCLGGDSRMNRRYSLLCSDLALMESTKTILPRTSLSSLRAVGLAYNFWRIALADF